MKGECMEEYRKGARFVCARQGRKTDEMFIMGERALKPYFYLRNGRLHIRYTVDRCIALSSSEEGMVKDDIIGNPADKQGFLRRWWQFFCGTAKKSIIEDGIGDVDRRLGNGEIQARRSGVR